MHTTRLDFHQSRSTILIGHMRQIACATSSPCQYTYIVGHPRRCNINEDSRCGCTEFRMYARANFHLISFLTAADVGRPSSDVAAAVIQFQYRERSSSYLAGNSDPADRTMRPPADRPSVPLRCRCRDASSSESQWSHTDDGPFMRPLTKKSFGSFMAPV